MVRWELDARRTALIAIDLQRLFVEGHPPISAPEGPRVVQALNALSGTCRELGVPVIYTAHALRPDLANLGLLGQQFPAMKEQRLLASGTERVVIDDRFRIEAGDIYLEKPRFGAFTGTDLELILRGKGIDTVIVGGIATNVCCETTVREASHREFRVVVLSDATASAGYDDVGFGALTAAEVQKATLTVIAHAFGEVTTCQDVAQRLHGQR